MVGQQLPQTNEKYYSVRCDPFYHYFTDLNTAQLNFFFEEKNNLTLKQVILRMETVESVANIGRVWLKYM